MESTEKKGGCDKHGSCPRCKCKSDKKLNVYDWLQDIPESHQDTEFVEVQFKNTRKGYFRNSNKLAIEKGDIIAVESNPGHDIGEVTLTGRLVLLQMKKNNIRVDNPDIRRVYRKAKPNDLEKYEEAKSREHETMLKARKIADDLHLNMKIGDVEYQGDGNKA
ncbi:MAG: PSP1 domain-containing protein, partial [Bacteroidales bacterium]